MYVCVILFFYMCVYFFFLPACADSSGGGLPFEVWCRFYHPNIRDQLMARVCKNPEISLGDWLDELDNLKKQGIP